MSQITTHAEVLPRQRAERGGAPMGSASSFRRSPPGSATGGASVIVSTLTRVVSGSWATRPFFPKARGIFMNEMYAFPSQISPAEGCRRPGGIHTIARIFPESHRQNTIPLMKRRCFPPDLFALECLEPPASGLGQNLQRVAPRGPVGSLPIAAPARWLKQIGGWTSLDKSR
jgi:hypothetical protein